MRSTSASRPARRASPCIRAPTAGTSRRTMCATIARVLGAAAGVEFNIEGDPRPELLDLVDEVRPDQCTLVPVAPARSPARPAGSPAAETRAAAGRHRDAQGARRPRQPLRRPRCRGRSSGRRRPAPIASSCTPSRSPARSSAGAAAGRDVVRVVRRRGAAGARRSGWASTPATISTSTTSCCSGAAVSRRSLDRPRHHLARAVRRPRHRRPRIPRRSVGRLI